ncbi:MAG: sulfatase-like hydrolase/transferase, partial [Verrucomicrobiota bacterium]|nr:sulfatase-like hydrolase/transferase [Verrucomicrobiota bacterium]
FELCFAAPLCAPSRALLLTGRYAFRTSVTDNGQGALATPQKDGSVALLMKQAGYATAVAGKWRQLSHLTTREDGAKWGFDEFLIWGARQPDEDEDRAAKKTTKGAAKPDRYWDPDYNHNGGVLKDVEGKYGPDVLNEFVLDFIRRNKETPFFVYYPTPLIHGPILKTPDSPGAAAGKLKDKKNPANVAKGSLYADNIAYLDKLIGKIVAELDALGLREKTLIVFTGDNGSVPVGTLHGRPVDGRKSQLTEGGSRVPLIASWPGTAPSGAVLKELVDLSDLLPTFAELAGAKPPESITIDGRSFAPQLRGKKGRPREWAYVQLGDQRYVRSDRWKLTGSGQFFDMRDAPFREIPVPADTTDAEAKTARAKLQAALSALPAQETGAVAPRKKRKKAAASLPAPTSNPGTQQ